MPLVTLVRPQHHPLTHCLRFAYEKACKAVRSKLPEPSQQLSLRAQPAYARVSTRQPVNRAAAIRQARSRPFSTRAASSFISYVRNGLKGGERAAYQQSRIAINVSRLTSRSPFSSTLRPNLTGGTLGRTAGGYTIGAGRVGGARYFSNGPAAPAQVINNVSAGVRAFFLSGQKIRFDGIDPISGNKQYKAVSKIQDQAERQMTAIPRTVPGSHIDFQISPTITAIGAMAGAPKKSASADTFESETLNSEGLLDMLSVDFARVLKDLTAVFNDLKRLSALGDLPVQLHNKSTIRVRFPGCDAETVERLCDEAGVQRGRIVQDEDFDARTGADVALQFPFAPSVPASPEVQYLFQDGFQAPEDVDWMAMMSSENKTPSTLERSGKDGNGSIFEDMDMLASNPWKSSSSGYSSINISDLGDRAFFPEISSAGFPGSTTGYDSMDGIHRFIAECDQAALRR